MEKHTLPMIIQDLKAKRDALSLAHEQLKKDNDSWNKCIQRMLITQVRVFVFVFIFK